MVATGDRTELGRISGLLGGVEPTQTPLTRSIARLGSTVTKVIGVVAVVLLAVALLRGYPVADAALAAITLAVAAIPEGLPAIVTIALAIGVQRMARGGRSSGSCPRWRRWAPPRWCAPTRRAR